MVLTLLQMRFSATPSIYGYFIHFSDLFRFWVKIQVLTYILKRRIQLFSGLHTHPFCMRAFTSRYHFQLLNPHCAFHLPERSLFRANLFNFFGGGDPKRNEQSTTFRWLCHLFDFNIPPDLTDSSIQFVPLRSKSHLICSEAYTLFSWKLQPQVSFWKIPPVFCPFAPFFRPESRFLLLLVASLYPFLFRFLLHLFFEFFIVFPMFRNPYNLKKSARIGRQTCTSQFLIDGFL